MKKILEELKKINERLDRLEAQQPSNLAKLAQGYKYDRASDCMHLNCPGCKNGTCSGIHMISCPCGSCSPTMM